MIHIYTQPKNTYQDIMKLTGLTYQGVSKHLLALKKKGYIKRSRYQHLEFTEKGMEILKTACQP